MTDRFEWNRQTFIVTGAREHTNRNGFPAPLVVLETACKQCGATIEVTVRKAKRLRLDRCRKRCMTCSPPRISEADGAYFQEQESM